MKHIVEVNGIKLYSFHGCLPEEEKIGGTYMVDVYMETNFSMAALTDELTETIDYVVVNRIVKEQMAIRSKLIEHVGQRIIVAIKNEVENIDLIRVKVIKICPPINGDVNNVAIIIEE